MARNNPFTLQAPLQKPLSANDVEVDWDAIPNGLTLVSAVLNDGRKAVDLVAKELWTPSDGGKEADHVGLGMKTATSSGTSSHQFKSNINRDYTAKPFTSGLLVVMDANWQRWPATWNTLFALDSTDYLGGPFFQYIPGGPTFELFHDGVAKDVFSVNLPLGRHTVAIGRNPGGIESSFLCLDGGAVYQSVAKTGNIGGSGEAAYGGVDNLSGRSPEAVYHFCLLFGGKIDSAKIQRLARNPYQILKPRKFVYGTSIIQNEVLAIIRNQVDSISSQEASVTASTLNGVLVL